MASTPSLAARDLPSRRAGAASSGDRIFAALCTGAGVFVLILLGAIIVELFIGGWPVFKAMGVGFVWGDNWDPVAEEFGALVPIYGTIITSILALLLAVPVAFGIAYFLTEIAPLPMRRPVGTAVELLAAVPSIIYGLLGLALFINWMHLPRASPLVGGLVLALMALPTIIIATRSSLKAVPPSIREAALAMGASKTQTVFQHTLPLAMPGVMTGAIISMAHALGETAPLLLIGMVSFIPGIPSAIGEPSGALPSLVYIWENASERAFHERTAAAILVLLAFMIVMNAAAIFLRRRFERRW